MPHLLARHALLFGLLLCLAALPSSLYADRANKHTAPTFSGRMSKNQSIRVAVSTDCAVIEKIGSISGQVTALALSEGRAYTGRPAGLDIFDVTNPVSPMLQGSLALQNIGSIQVVGSLAYVTNGQKLSI